MPLTPEHKEEIEELSNMIINLQHLASFKHGKKYDSDDRNHIHSLDHAFDGSVNLPICYEQEVKTLAADLNELVETKTIPLISKAKQRIKDIIDKS